MIGDNSPLFTGDRWRTGENWGFWFRIFGYGFAVSTLEPVFAKGNNRASTIHVFGIKIKPLNLGK